MSIADDIASARAGLAQVSAALDLIDAFLVDLSSLEATPAPGATSFPRQDSSSTGGPLPDGTPSTGAVSSGDATVSQAATSPADTSAAPAVADTESTTEDASETVEEAPPTILADGTPVPVDTSSAPTTTS